MRLTDTAVATSLLLFCCRWEIVSASWIAPTGNGWVCRLGDPAYHPTNFHRETCFPTCCLHAYPQGQGDISEKESLQNGSENDRNAVAITGVTLKIAVDAQGAAADLAGRSERFTDAPSLDMVHRLRAVSDAVLIGKTTCVMDDPSLTVRRHVPFQQQPIRLVLDPTLSLLRNETIRKTYQLFQPGTEAEAPPKTILVYDSDHHPDETSSKQIVPEQRKDLPPHVACLAVPRATTKTPNDRYSLSIPFLLDTLARRFNVHHLMVEGGPATAQQFLPHVDRCLLVRAVNVCFSKPLNAGLSHNVLKEAGLQHLGTRTSGADEIDYWSRQDWPTDELSDWP